jgi:hypothetical protein
VNEVNPYIVNGAAVVVKGGQRFDLRFPVEMIFPVATELPHEVKTDAILPARPGNLIGPACSSKARTEIFHGGSGVGKWERFYAHRSDPLCVIVEDCSFGSRALGRSVSVVNMEA